MDDWDSCHDVGDRGVSVAADDHVDQPRRQRARKAEDLAVGIAAREIARIVEAPALAARVRDDDDDVRTTLPETGRLPYRRGREWSYREPLEARPLDDVRSAFREEPHHADAHPSQLDLRAPLQPFPQRRASVAGDEVCGEHGKRSLRDAPLERALRIVSRVLLHRCGAFGTEVELVVAQGERGVAHGAVRGDDRRALAEIRLDRALERIAGVDQEHPGLRTRPPQVVHEACKDG